MTHQKTIYLPDTNLLFDLALSISHPEALNPWQRTQTLGYWKYLGSDTQIPAIVWAEFCGLWLHKRVDFTNYDHWFESRMAVFGLMYRELKVAKVVLCEETGLVYPDILGGALHITLRKMPEDFIQQVTTRINKTIQNCNSILTQNPCDDSAANALQRNTRNLVEGKLLDGLDSIIVSFAYEFARRHRNWRIVVVSNDKLVVEFLRYFNRNSDCLKELKVPENTWAAPPWQLLRKGGQ